MSKIVLKLLNGIFRWTAGVIITVTLLFSVFSIWDNAQIYQHAENVQDEVRALKPDVETEEGPGLEELKAINADVIGWLTVDGTNIDYPVLQGETNLTYMNKDVYGEFSLAGSIFLDTRNSSDFSDNYSLIYGHNMSEHLMFGDLALFKDKTFFEKNITASLMTSEEVRTLEVAAVLQVSAGTEDIFDPTVWKENFEGFGRFIEENSIWYHSELITALIRYPGEYEVVTLVTCSSGSTNDRTVLILMNRKSGKKPGEKDPAGGTKGDGNKTPDTKTDPVISGNGSKNTGDHSSNTFWKYLLIGGCLFIVLFELLERLWNKYRRTDDEC